ncbi:MAG: hypothetical protein JEZ00_17055 [Anaerolineaceae bacterium]|nr:hypothetical protein [Anaerolineaceae bacterium]
MEAPIFESEGSLESTENRDIESQELDNATFEPKALVEQGGDYERSEAIQTAVETLIENELVNTDQLEYEPGHPPEPPDLDHGPPHEELVQEEDKSILGSMPKMREDLDQMKPAGTESDGKVEATPINLPNPVEQGVPIAGSGNDVSATPINLPNPVEQGVPIVGSGNDVSATPINLPNPVEQGVPIVGSGNDVSATPINLPNPVEEVSATPITLPGQNAEVSVTSNTNPAQNDVSSLPIPLPGPGNQVSATPINLPNTVDEGSATPINTPTNVIHDPEIETQPQGLSEPIRELDVQKPEHGLKQAEEGMGISTDMDDFMPKEGSLIGPDGKPMSDDKFGLDGILNEDYGFGSGGPEDLRDAAASDHPDIIPGTDSPFIPGKGPGSDVLEGGGGMRDDKLDKYLEDEAQDKRASEIKDMAYYADSPIHNSGLGKGKQGNTKAKVPEYDDEMPPDIPDPDDDTSSFEEGPSKKAGISDHSQDVMNPRYDSDLISITTPDDPDGSETAEAVLPQYAEKVEEVAKQMKQVIAPEKKIGAELITDPPEHDAKNSQDKGKTAKN